MMKAALVLYAQSSSLSRMAAELDLVFSPLSSCFDSVELWYFYCGKKEDEIPRFSFRLTRVLRIGISMSHKPELFLDELLGIHGQSRVDLIMFPGDGLGGELATRLAYRLKGSSSINIERCFVSGGKLEVEREAYGHHLSARFSLASSPFCISVAKQASKPIGFEKVDPQILDDHIVASSSDQEDNDFSLIPENKTVDFTSADFIVALGLGSGSKDRTLRLQNVARSLGAEPCASRPVVMNGWMEMERLIGASGAVVSPSVCIAAGISGMGAFTFGIRGSKLIVAINTDPKAPIFKIADVGIVDDLLETLLELEKIVNEQRNKDT
ncbi:MAG: electron transfer flavoprotein subunit alpha/FixB family protein [Oligoflexales bacterium]|nr:electron transfer flavoprotein subunit alpha/FixB family protein [Oligoflexales bacterium]